MSNHPHSTRRARRCALRIAALLAIAQAATATPAWLSEAFGGL
jgi:hypothetical protein